MLAFSKSIIAVYIVGALFIFAGLLTQFQFNVMAGAIALYVGGSVLISTMAVLQFKEYNDRPKQ